MSLLNTGLNALGTAAALKSIFGKSRQGNDPKAKMGSFIAEIRNKSVARTNFFDVTFTVPEVIAGSSMGPKLSLWAEGAQLPGMNLQTDSLKPYGFGPQESIPYTLQTNDITVNFIGDGRGAIQRYFYEWMQRIVRGDEDSRSGRLSITGQSPYEVEFKNRYACTITITTYNDQGTPVAIYELYDAFPKTMPDVSLSWNDSSSFMQFGITFAYTRMKFVNSTEAVPTTQGGRRKLNVLDRAIKVATAVQALSTIRRPRNLQDALSSATTVKGITSSFGTIR